MPGEILTLRAFGNVILVTTSARQLVAYTDLGIRMWQLDLDEIAPAPPVRVSDSEVVVVDLAGEVRRLAIATGAVVWQHSLGSDVTATAGGRGGDRGRHGSGRHGHRAGRGDRAIAGGRRSWRAWRPGSSGHASSCCRTRPPTDWTPPRATGAGCGPSSARSPTGPRWRPAGPGHARAATVLLDQTGRVTGRLARLPAAHRRDRPDGRLGRTRGRARRPRGCGQPALAAAQPDPGGAGPAGASARRRVCCCSTPTGRSRPGTMSADDRRAGCSRPGPRDDRRSRLGRFLAAVLRQTLVEPVNGGRLRNLDWPYGLPALVVAGYAMFALAGADGDRSPARSAGESTLIMSGLQTVGLPSGRRLAAGGAAVLRRRVADDRGAARAVVAEDPRACSSC